ncbi:Conserved_hypothetical protein [Hexamita inflata]|uniref:Leucine rich repeat protein n=1 Tax=Hexamita inflata TaxID=28002 RepID=A0AA86N8K4_9EUKA|nr:Conserved hypothetical protein [Hexamita inflata]
MYEQDIESMMTQQLYYQLYYYLDITTSNTQNITDSDRIQFFIGEIQNKTLLIGCDNTLHSLEFLNDFEINKLKIVSCENVIPKIKSKMITEMQILNSRINNIHELELENLEILQLDAFLEYNAFINIQGISKYLKLKQLKIYEYKNLDISCLKQMSTLTKLELGSCGLSNINALQTLVNLKQLNLAENKNIDITPLQHLNQLTILNLNFCAIKTIDVLQTLYNLDKLSICYNQIIYLQPLIELKMLTKLQTGGNKIVDSAIIEDHPNYNLFELLIREQPQQEEITMANIFKYINYPITILKRMRLQRQKIIIKYSKSREKSQKTILDNELCLFQFSEQVSVLFTSRMYDCSQ